MRYVFVDEFGGVSLFAPNEPVLVIAAVITGKPRNLDGIIKRVRHRLAGGRPLAELKASHTEDNITCQILQAVAGQDDVEIITVVVDKRGILRPPNDPEDLYRQAVARVLRLCVTRGPHLEVILDKRYTQAHQRRKLERCIRDEIVDVPQQAVMLRQEDSQVVKGLQVADFVAWAMGQKHQHGESRYCALIEQRIVVEEIIVVK